MEVQLVMKLLRGILEITFYVALTAGLIWAVPRALSWALKTSYPLAVVTSGSMWPVLKTGDLVLVKGTTGDVLGVSDIAVYEHAGGFAIHRVVKKNENTFVTKGDANRKDDSPVSYDQLVGRALTVAGKPIRIPFVGSVGNFLRGKFL
mgnify:CR=1 FL=1